jgi:hypothetical protein
MRITPREQPEVYRVLPDRAARDDEPQQAAALLLAFAPLHKRALGVAFGVAGALLMLFLTAIDIVRDPRDRFPLDLLSQYFYGYTSTWEGALVGAAWGFGVGFVAGWFVAFCRNLSVAISIFTIRTRAELAETRDFLDHI